MTTESREVRKSRRSAPFWVFFILLGSYAYFWHARDWNTASRLMLTYAMVDRGTIRLDGLDGQTRDIAFFRGHYYTDKLPGMSWAAAPGYAAVKVLLGLDSHPLDVPALRHWPADYWATLMTSGLATAGCGAILTLLASRLGCGPGSSALVGLSYGLATPAYVYATLANGHQLTAFFLLAAFTILRGLPSRGGTALALLAGFLAASAPVVELQVGPVSAILGAYLLALAIGRRVSPATPAAFAVGALPPTLALLGYNTMAFGNPLDMGYFHHATEQFARVHSEENPLGLSAPAWDRAGPLLWGDYRGLLFYAPVLVLAPAGWVVLARRGRWGTATLTLLACSAVFLVNLSYPEWTGGWSTGPRLLVPMLPFAMIPVAALLAVGGRTAIGPALLLTLGGAFLMLLFQGVGARIPQDVEHPLSEVVWPLWSGDPMPAWWPGDRFARNLASLAAPRVVQWLPDSWGWVQFSPLILAQGAAVVVMLRSHRAGTRATGIGRGPAGHSSPGSSPDPGVRPC